MPTIVENVQRDAALSCEEVFAPVMTLETVDTMDEAIAIANDSDYGLQAGIFTKDIDVAFRAFDRLEVGAVVVNDVPTVRVDSMPYGGVKGSGLGREGVRSAIEAMTEQRLLVVRSA